MRNMPQRIGDEAPVLLARIRAAMDVAPYCESPIEIMFGSQLIAALQTSLGSHFAFCKQEDEDKQAKDCILLIPQYKWDRYRADWALKIPVLTHPYVFIECDGKEFHSTKEQLKRDQEREASIVKNNIRVLRFTGSEINSSTPWCVEYVVRYIARIMGVAE